MMRLLSRALQLFTYWIRFRGDSVAYLRSLGAVIGAQCDVLTQVNNFGSEPWLVQLGNQVTLGAGTVLITHDGASRLFRKQFVHMNRFGNRFGTIVIHDNCFIGTNTIILPGVVIGANSIVGAGSVVTQSIPPETVWAGNPARQICTLQEYIEKYKAKMVTLNATDPSSLRQELTKLLWGEKR